MRQEVPPKIRHGKRLRWFQLLCDCGNTHRAALSELLNGGCRSCGCFMVKSRVKHGGAKFGNRDSRYGIWAAMKQRCYNPKSNLFHRYGGRGITVCRRWIKSFKDFALDMGERPSGGSIERVDNNKGYCKSNCVWATGATQQRNTGRNKFVTYKGERRCIGEWASILGFNYETLRGRIVNRGWSIDDAFTAPPDAIANRGKAVHD